MVGLLVLERLTGRSPTREDLWKLLEPPEGSEPAKSEAEDTPAATSSTLKESREAGRQGGKQSRFWLPLALPTLQEPEGKPPAPPPAGRGLSLPPGCPVRSSPGREKGGDAITPLPATTPATPAPPQPPLDTAAWYRDLFCIKAVWGPPSPQPRERLLRGQSGTTPGMLPRLGPAAQSSGALLRDLCEQDAESRPLGSVLPGQERG